MSKSPAVSSFLVAFASVSLYAQVHLGSVSVGSKSTETVTVTIGSGGKLGSLSVVTGGAAEMDFTNAGGGSCSPGVIYAPNSTCTVRVQFTPRLTGNRSGGVLLTDAFGNSMATVYLSGIGLGPQAAFQPATRIPLLNGLNNVAAVTVDPSTNVYVAESQAYPGFEGAPEVPGGLFKAAYVSRGKYEIENIGALLIDPVGVAVDGAGNVLEADALLDPSIGQQQGAAGPVPGYFHEARSLAVDAQGYIYSAGGGSVYKSSPAFASDQTYSTVVSGFGNIRSLAVDGQGNLYIPDSGVKPAVYKETLTESGYIQTKIGSGWVQPVGIAVDANGVVYVNDSGIVYAETPQPNGHYISTALFANQNNGTSPAGLAVDGDGNLYVPVYGGPGPFGSFFDVYKYDRSAPPALTFATTPAANTSADSPRTVTLSNLGNQPLQVSSIHYPADFPESAKGPGRCTPGITLAAGASCNLVADFAPVNDPSGGESSEAMQEAIEIVTNNLNSTAAIQSIPLAGTAIPQPIAAVPVISQPSGTFTASQTIALSTPTPGASIYYTINGETPSQSNGTRYTGPRSLNTSAKLQAIAYAPGQKPSPVVSATYTFVAIKPVISPAGGAYTAPVTVSIATATQGATIFYTTDGTLPTTSSKVYSRPFTVGANQHVHAIAAKTGYTTSATVEQTYTVAP